MKLMRASTLSFDCMVKRDDYTSNRGGYHACYRNVLNGYQERKTILQKCAETIRELRCLCLAR